MFSRLSRMPFRRCLSTRPPVPHVRSSYRKLNVVGAGATAVALCITWQLMAERNRIALDAPSVPQAEQTPEKDFTPDEPPKSDDKTATEGEAESSGGGGGAYNPETGEINWDCPCLGGMAHGPCGENFREAFSCFVFSEQEPKGIDCVEKFKAMQNCFREHPDVYGEEIMDDDAEEGEPSPAPAAANDTLPDTPTKSEHSPPTKTSKAPKATPSS